MKHARYMTSLALACALGLAGAASAETEIRISTAAPGNAPLTDAFNHIAEVMNTTYPDDIEVTVHHSSTLFKQGTELPAMQRGNLEMASPVTFEIEQQLPEYGVFGAAYLFRDSAHMLKVFGGEMGQQFYDDVAEKMGIVILSTAYLGTRTVNLAEAREVTGPDDLKGVKMRMPPGPAFQTLASALGVTPVAMPITEVYLGLKTGAIDAQDNPTNMTRDWKFDEQTEQVILTKHLVQPVFIAINKDVFDGLTPEQQATLREAAQEGAALQIEKTLKDETDAIQTFLDRGLTITEVDTEPFRAAVWAAYEEQGLTDAWKPGLADAIAATE
ncbi:TRAP transporter substrate-binding protein DctP [Mesobacterium pallidum]|uniref:TRAP transporter substrate-binding protein DctP n=1 Tax=Mesobacterium pallidum TaxID=2872037 RepID=UPI001EE20A21|nr:TRAP transporter substrate-binding protein DctP [Mesobacterium pallidum]